MVTDTDSVQLILGIFQLIFQLCHFYPNVTALRSGLCYRNSVCRLSSVCLSVYL